MSEVCKDSSRQERQKESAHAVTPALDSPTKKIRRKHLINKLNHLNFSDKPVLLVFSSDDYAQNIEYEGTVSPCSEKEVLIVIKEIENPKNLLEYSLNFVVFKTSTGVFRFSPTYFHVSKNGIAVEIPSYGEKMAPTATAYLSAKNCTARVFQNAVELSGQIERFSSKSFIFMCETHNSSNLLINTDSPAHVLISNTDGPVFSGDCSISPLHIGSKSFTLAPDINSVQRFPSKEYRSARIILDNLPQLSFNHPLSGTYMEFQIHDISGTGFRISNQNAILFPGLKIYNAQVTFPDGTKLICSIQIIHSKDDLEDSSVGMGILDIAPRDHLKLLAMLHQARDPFAFLCKKINLHQLMEFFFDSGFIYPAKYTYLQKYKEKILTIYDKLYSTENNVARHFIYQKGNNILGHLAMLRYSEKGWLIHHHAAAAEGGMNAGIHVLNQATSFITDSYRFHRMDLNFILCFFRPDNKFPQKVFGSLVSKINNRQLCSIDNFLYTHLNCDETPSDNDESWVLSEPGLHDFQVLTSYYEEISGGLLLEAMDILPHQSQNSSISTAYNDIGIGRHIRLRILKNKGRAAAFFIINTSDPGLNMSELTNNLMIIIINEKLIDKNRLLHTAYEISNDLGSAENPLLIYPKESAENLEITAEITYELWIIRSTLSDVYHEHVENLFRGSIKNLSSSAGSST